MNGMLPPLFSKEEREKLEGVGATSEDANLDPGHRCGARRQEPREHANACRRRVWRVSRARFQLPNIFLPLLFEDAATPAGLRELAKRVWT